MRQVSSSYYNALSKPMDSFLFILNKQSHQLDVFDAHMFMEMCIIIEEDSCLVVSPLSVYHEHD